jgi:MoxR-like ATPase
MEEKMPQKITELQNQLEKIIKGKKDITDKILMAVLAKGHVLLEDVPGVGKTTTALALSRLMGMEFNRIQFTPDVVPSDVTGFTMYDKQNGQFSYHEGAVMCNLLLADEINRTSSKTQSALLEVMEEGRVTVDGETHCVPSPFVVIATENPVGSSGTQLLPESQLDRFMIKLSVGYSDRESEMQILDNSRAVHPVENLTAVTDKTELLEMMNRVENIKVNEAVRGYIADIGNASRHNSEIKLGLSTRGLIALKNMSQARAALRGREFVTPDDVKAVAPYVCVHRLICRSTVMRDPDSAKREILDKMIKELPVPTEQI